MRNLRVTLGATAVQVGGAGELRDGLSPICFNHIIMVDVDRYYSLLSELNF